MDAAKRNSAYIYGGVAEWKEDPQESQPKKIKSEPCPRAGVATAEAKEASVTSVSESKSGGAAGGAKAFLTKDDLETFLWFHFSEDFPWFQEELGEGLTYLIQKCIKTSANWMSYKGELPESLKTRIDTAFESDEQDLELEHADPIDSPVNPILRTLPREKVIELAQFCNEYIYDKAIECIARMPCSENDKCIENLVQLKGRILQTATYVLTNV